VIESVVTARRNGPLIAQAAKLWIKPDDLVVDVTWGRGRFWTDFQPERLIRHDLYTLDGVDFRVLPEVDASVDVVVLDPPYTAPGGRATSTIADFNDRYGIDLVPATVADTQELIAAGIKEATRVLKQGGRMIVKNADYISSGRFVTGHHHVVSTALACGLSQVDEFIFHGGQGPQPKVNRDGSPRRQVHARRVHSFLSVFQLGRRRPTAEPSAEVIV
jgi:hypothetical protein